MAQDLRTIYQVPTIHHAEAALDRFAERWDERYPTISKLWRRRWDHLTPFFAFLQEFRKVIYTTNAIESMNRELRKIIKTSGPLPQTRRPGNCSICPEGGHPIANRTAAINQFVIMYEDRVPVT